MSVGIKARPVSHRCDKQMKRSKEKCMTPQGKRWRCTGECKKCICNIIQDEYGGERHTGVTR